MKKCIYCFVLILVGCGGGGGGGSPTIAPSSNPPPPSDTLIWDQGNWDEVEWQ